MDCRNIGTNNRPSRGTRKDKPVRGKKRGKEGKEEWKKKRTGGRDAVNE